MTRIAVVGAGGMGSVLAAHLARGGIDTVLVGRSPAHVDALMRRGLRLLGPDGAEDHVAVPATTDPATWGRADHVIVLTKSFDTSAAAATAAALTGPGTWVATLQNGLGNTERLAERIDPTRVLPGTTTIGGTLEAPGVVSMSALTAAGRSRTDLGPPTGEVGLDGPAELAAALSSVGLPAEATVDIDRRIWGKLALAVMGPVSALVRATVGDTLDHDGTGALLETLHDEVVAVAHAEGIELDRSASWEHAVATYRGTGQHFTSMASDIIGGRRTEIDAILGEVVRRGLRRGVAVPAGAAVVALLRATQDIAASRA